MLYAIVAVILLIADQWLKYTVTVNITLATGSVELIPNVVSLVNIHNSGAAFSFLSNAEFARWLFLGIAVIFVVLVIIMLVKRMFPSKFVTWCGVFAMAGAIGNCIDRILYGYVVDMIKLEFVNFAVFNFADVILVLSCLAFIGYIIADMMTGGSREAEDDAEEYPDIAVSGIESGLEPFPETAQPVRIEKAAVREPDPAMFTAEAPVRPEPVQEPAPAPKPAADEFDLDSILAEFR